MFCTGERLLRGVFIRQHHPIPLRRGASHHYQRTDGNDSRARLSGETVGAARPRFLLSPVW
jgi:hypothetical protein